MGLGFESTVTYVYGSLICASWFIFRSFASSQLRKCTGLFLMVYSYFAPFPIRPFPISPLPIPTGPALKVPLPLRDARPREDGSWGHPLRPFVADPPGSLPLHP